MWMIFVPLYILSSRAAVVIMVITALIITIATLALGQYFAQSFVPLGAELFAYKISDIIQTVGASGGVKVSFIFLLLAIVAATFLIIKWLPRKLKINTWSSAIVDGFLILFTLILSPTIISGKQFKSDFESNIAINKTDFFFSRSYTHFFPTTVENDIYADSYIGDFEQQSGTLAEMDYVDEEQFPFLHKNNTPDVLSPFFNKTNTPPNVVIILVEGLGRAFTNEGAYLGNFTPFIDSLSNESLYWENFLSEGGRTFAVLPSILGSLPFSSNGFSAMGNSMPDHLSILSLLKKNGYQTSFHYGGDASFDNMDLFLKKSNIDKINDIHNFPAGYTQMPLHNGSTWGFGDKELYRRYLALTPVVKQPYANVLLTVSSHNPFVINEQEKYLQRFEIRMDELGIDGVRKDEYRLYKQQYASILYTDDALKDLFKSYAQRSDFNNTIFIITGDHRMPEIPMASKLDRYHVPFLIYSGLLQRTAKFSSISTHFDVAPTLMAYFKNNFGMQMPSLVSWVGSGIDTSKTLQNNHAYALMQTKTDLVDFVTDKYQLNSGDVFIIGQDLTTQKDNNNSNATSLNNAFEAFKAKNNKIVNGAKIIPDSIYKAYHPK